MSRRARLWVIWGVIALASGVVFAFPPIPQNAAYHDFADQRSFLGVVNGLDVLSNIAFLIVGILGLVFLLRPAQRTQASFLQPRERWPYVVFFSAVALTCLGSSYYHLLPGNSRLVWDRLPMAAGFMSLVAATIAERVSVHAGIRWLVPFILLGVGSVLEWNLTEQRGHGDLRLYAIVQFGSLLAIVLLVTFQPPRYSRGWDLLVALGMYTTAKLFESLDRPIFSATGVVSGHTMKHLAAAAATYWILRMLELRGPLAVPEQRAAYDRISGFQSTKDGAL